MSESSRSRFKPLKYTRGYDDYIAIGIASERQRISEESRHCYEAITSYHIQHLRPSGNTLKPVYDMVEFTDTNVFDSLHRYFPVKKRVLVVANNTLVLLGSADFVSQLEDNEITLAKGKVDAMDLGHDCPGQLSTEQFIVSAPPTIVSYVRVCNGTEYTVIDIGNWGFRHPDDIYHRLPEAERQELSSLMWSKYKTDDSLRTTALLARFMQEYFKVVRTCKLGEPTTTYAGQAMRAYRLRLGKDAIKTHERKEVAELEARAYTLGRNEVRFQGYYPDECYLVDIHALYPHLGATREFPVELADYQESPSNSTVEKWCQTSCVISQVRIRTNEEAYRCQDGNRVIYPVGEFNCYLSGDEVREALERGHVCRVYRAARYRTAPILRAYSRHMLEQRAMVRANNNEIAECIVKLITNGLWGKFGQLGSRWVICPDVATGITYGGYIKLDRERRTHEYYRVLDGVASKLEYVHFADNTFPAISCVANAYSRSLIWKLMNCAGLLDVLYVGIDSLIVTRQGYSRLVSSGKLREKSVGCLRLVQRAQGCYIRSPGVYSIGTKTAYSGMARINAHRTIGFWNQRSGVCTDDRTGKHTRTIVSPYNSPVEARERLAMMDESPGQFIGPTPIYQDVLDLSHPSPARVQPTFRFGEYGR